MKYLQTFESFVNEANWHSSSTKAIEHESEIKSSLEKLVKLTPESKKIIKQYNLESSIIITGSHWTDDTGGISIEYNLGSDPAVTVQISMSVLKSGKNQIIISGWKGKGATLRNKYQDYRTSMTSAKYEKMSELTLNDILDMLKNVAPDFNKYLNGNLEIWSIGVAREKDYYK
jgi:hypothetical protein